VTDQIRTKRPRPARRRLIIAAVIWLLLIRTVLLIGADTLEIPDVVYNIVGVGLLLAIFIPLSLAAMKELNDLRQRGEAPLPKIPTRRSLIGFGAFMIAFWCLALWVILSNDNFVFPLLPILGTIWLIVNIRRHNRAGDPPQPSLSTRAN
jgi:hypothetical protein